jgi:hypothetical protein
VTVAAGVLKGGRLARSKPFRAVAAYRFVLGLGALAAGCRKRPKLRRG